MSRFIKVTYEGQTEMSVNVDLIQSIETRYAQVKGKSTACGTVIRMSGNNLIVAEPYSEVAAMIFKETETPSP